MVAVASETSITSGLEDESREGVSFMGGVTNGEPVVAPDSAFDVGENIVCRFGGENEQILEVGDGERGRVSGQQDG